MADFTPTQGRYLAFIHAYTRRRGMPPAEAEIAAAMCVSPPSVNQMMKTLERKGLIFRQPGVPRTIRVLVPEEEIPSLRGSGDKRTRRASEDAEKAPKLPAAPPANLYVLKVYLLGGPIGEKFANKEISRVIEIRGDQTLHQLHETIFQAYDRRDQHPYEFQLGRRPHDPAGPNYRHPFSSSDRRRKNCHDACSVTLDELKLEQHRAFGYWFDFGDDWFHQVDVERTEEAIPTVTYPRVVRRVGKSPPQYMEA